MRISSLEKNGVDLASERRKSLQFVTIRIQFFNKYTTSFTKPLNLYKNYFEFNP